MEALKDLIGFVPEWHLLLDDLNSKIADRQVELAQLAESEYRPPTRSLRNKGSTESLKPDEEKTPRTDGFSPKDEGKGHSSDPLIYSAGGLAAGAPSSPSKASPMPPPLLNHHSSPGGASLQKRPSKRLNTGQAGGSPMTPPILRKRKTESVASGGSQPPKYRTRSMIIVYYDSFVQNAFENLVKYISTSRNAMRKGKMAARMASMRQMAEMEVDDDDDDDDSGADGLPSLLRPVRNGPVAPASFATSGSGPILADNDDDLEMIPKLKFVSTRDMGPKRDSPGAMRVNRTGLTPGAIRPQRRGMTLPIASTQGSNIFDELDTGLEWCQSMCEHAAHQFLRDGDCSIEIEGIKRRLAEVRETAEQEMSKTGIIDLDVEPVDQESDGGRKYDRSREMRSILMRRPINSPKPLEADEMEVDDDDEGFEDEIPNIVWKSSRARMV